MRLRYAHDSAYDLWPIRHRLGINALTAVEAMVAAFASMSAGYRFIASPEAHVNHAVVVTATDRAARAGLRIFVTTAIELRTHRVPFGLVLGRRTDRFAFSSKSTPGITFLLDTIYDRSYHSYIDGREWTRPVR